MEIKQDPKPTRTCVRGVGGTIKGDWHTCTDEKRNPAGGGAQHYIPVTHNQKMFCVIINFSKNREMVIVYIP